MAACGLFFTTVLFFFLCIGAISAFAQDTTRYDFEIITISNQSAKELLPQVQAILSPGGRALVDTITNAIIISDTSKHIQQAREIVQMLDRPIPQVRIHLRYRQATTSTRSLATGGGISSRGNGLQMSTKQNHQNKNLQLLISSGSSGYLLIGANIPFTRYWLDLCGRYGYRYGWFTEYNRIESGFEVTPRVFGNRVDVELVPRISFADHRQIRFIQAATRITIPVDTWVTVAASDVDVHGVHAAILTAGGKTTTRAMLLEIKVHIR